MKVSINVWTDRSAAAVITVKVYDSSGRKVRGLFSGASAPGLNTIQWDGRNGSGARVSNACAGAVSGPMAIRRPAASIP